MRKIIKKIGNNSKGIILTPEECQTHGKITYNDQIQLEIQAIKKEGAKRWIKKY